MIFTESDQFRRANVKAAFPCLLLLVFLTGCIIVAPTPSKDPVRGQVIQPSETEFIRVGVTTKGEVTNRLGAGFRDCIRPPALAYSWELPAASIAILAFSLESAAAHQFERSYWRALFIAFDQDGTVTKKKFVRLSGNKSLDDQLESWAKRASRK